MLFKNSLTSLLGIDIPIIQGGMAWVATGELAGAVSEAGGLGVIGAGNAPANIVKKEIKKVKKLTEKPFAVNIMLLSPYVDEIIDLVIDEQVPIVTTGAGNPGKYINRLKKADIKIIPVVPSITMAKRLEKVGADCLIAEGTESGGHIGELTTMVLVPQMVEAVKIPVIAAGGIADARGLIAAIVLGAQGVQIGTRFVCSNECTAHYNYKKAIINSRGRDAIVTGRSTGHPVRNLKNKFSKNLSELESRGTSKEEIEEFGRGKLRLAVIDGDTNNGSVMAGQAAGLINDIKPVQKIIYELLINAKNKIEELGGLL